MTSWVTHTQNQPSWHQKTWGHEPPNCSSCLQWLAGKKYRTVMDLRWGFYQCLLSEATRKIFTCVTSFGTYCYNRLTMGFINSTAEFQRHVNITLGDNLWADAMAMVDDLIIANESLESHRASSQVIWNKLARRHHSVKPAKVGILQKMVEYLGYISTPDGTCIADRHKEAILNMELETDAENKCNKTSVRSFIGLVNWCRAYIEACGKKTACLNDLTTEAHSGCPAAEHYLSWELLKYEIAINKGVWHVNYKHPIMICADGSKLGIGGYIYQNIEGKERVISYFSRKTRKEEQKWDTRELEILALICTLEHFHVIIDGQTLSLQSDHKNLLWLMQQKDLGGRLGRWVLRLSQYPMTISYRKGKYMEVADCMSRNAQKEVLLEKLNSREESRPATYMMRVIDTRQATEDTCSCAREDDRVVDGENDKDSKDREDPGTSTGGGEWQTKKSLCSPT